MAKQYPNKNDDIELWDNDELSVYGANLTVVSRYIGKIRARDAQPVVKRLRHQEERASYGK